MCPWLPAALLTQFLYFSSFTWQKVAMEQRQYLSHMSLSHTFSISLAWWKYTEVFRTVTSPMVLWDLYMGLLLFSTSGIWQLVFLLPSFFRPRKGKEELCLWAEELAVRPLVVCFCVGNLQIPAISLQPIGLCWWKKSKMSIHFQIGNIRKQPWNGWKIRQNIHQNKRDETCLAQ